MILDENVYRRIRLDAIRPDIPFPLSIGRDDDGLARSISEIGLATPLVLWPVNGELALLCGARRLKALRYLGRTDCPALILPEQVPPDEALHLAIEENLAHRGFNEAEKVLAVRHLSRHLPEAAIYPYLKKLGVPPREEYLERYRRLDRLGPDGLDALSRDGLDPETGEILLRMNPQDRRAAGDLLTQLGSGRNKRRQLALWLEEIVRKSGVSVESILKDGRIADTLSSEKMNAPVKEKRVREMVMAMRYPELSRLQEKQATLLRRLNLPSGLRLTPPPDFEGLDFTVAFAFSDKNGLAAAIEKLEQISGSQDLADLLELG